MLKIRVCGFCGMYFVWKYWGFENLFIMAMGDFSRENWKHN
jgi:hypothetical protein